MAEKEILSKNQKNILKTISKDKMLCEGFYLTGGTALAEFYLHHRYKVGRNDLCPCDSGKKYKCCGK